MEHKNEHGIDLDLYSRQIGAYGVKAMGKLIKLRVFVGGLRGVSDSFLAFYSIITFFS